MGRSKKIKKQKEFTEISAAQFSAPPLIPPDTAGANGQRQAGPQPAADSETESTGCCGKKKKKNANAPRRKSMSRGGKRQPAEAEPKTIVLPAPTDTLEDILIQKVLPLMAPHDLFSGLALASKRG